MEPQEMIPHIGDAEPIEFAKVGVLTTQLTAEYLEHYALLPLRVQEPNILVATWTDQRDLDPPALDDLRLIFDREIELVRCAESAIMPVIRGLYDIDSNTA